MFVDRAGIHLTTSGKVQRASMRAAFLKGELTDVVHEEQLTMTDIAIVGMDCRFPKADDPAALWKLLLDGGRRHRRDPGRALERGRTAPRRLRSTTVPAG